MSSYLTVLTAEADAVDRSRRLREDLARRSRAGAPPARRALRARVLAVVVPHRKAAPAS